MPTETAANVDELQAGEAMDALVAEKVMGMSADEIAVRRSPLSSSLLHGAGIGRGIKPIPAYSTDIGAAWEVFRHRCLTAQVIGYTPQSPAQRPDLTDMADNGWVLEWSCTAAGRPIHAPTAPLAICRAALKAVSP